MAGFADSLQRRGILTHRDPAEELTGLMQVANPNFIFKHSRRFYREPLYLRELHGPEFQNPDFLKKFTTAFPSMSRQLQTMMEGSVMERRWNETWGSAARRRTRVVLDDHRDHLTCTHTYITPDRIQRAAFQHRLNNIDHYLAVDHGHFAPQPGRETMEHMDGRIDNGRDDWTYPLRPCQRSDIAYGDRNQKFTGLRAASSPNRLMTMELTADVSKNVLDEQRNHQMEGWIESSPDATWVS